MQNFPGELRFDVGQRQRSHTDAAVADLVPIVTRLSPAAVRAIELQRGLKTLFHHRLLQRGSLLGRPGIIKPVVADGEGMRHLRSVEEVPGVPVLELRGSIQLLPSALGVALIAVQALEQGQRIDPLHHPAAGSQQTQAVGDLIARRRLAQHLLRLGLELGVPGFKLRVGGDALLQLGKVVRRGEEPWMRLVEVGENVGCRGNRHG